MSFNRNFYVLLLIGNWNISGIFILLRRTGRAEFLMRINYDYDLQLFYRRSPNEFSNIPSYMHTSYNTRFAPSPDVYGTEGVVL
jgi:hypothetical protein